VGFLDALLGRTKPAQPNLDRLFGLPAARITLEASEGLVPSGEAGVCFKPAAGEEFAAAETEIAALLDLGDGDNATGEVTKVSLAGPADEFGYRWIVCGATDFDTLVTRVHVVNSTLEEHGYGPQLLCSVFGFHPVSTPGAAPVAGGLAQLYLVYLYKRGSFYPFVPLGGEKRDNEAELRLKTELGEDLSIEKDLDRWFPLWKLPVH
jgi:hypothetical protein